MRKESTNLFNGGLNFDLNPLTTPPNVLTDALNSTYVTFNADELSLQNDSGNTKIKAQFPNAPVYSSGGTYNIGDVTYVASGSDKIYYRNKTGANTSLATDWTDVTYVQLSEEYYPIGIKEYGGVLYIVSTNGTRIEFGSYPAPEKSGTHSSNAGEVVNFNEDIENNQGTLYKELPTGVEESCLVDGTGRNTGYKPIQYQKYKSVNGGAWTAEGDPYMREVISTSCPLPESLIAFSLHGSAYDTINEVKLSYKEGELIDLTTYSKSGYNYLFISVPQGKTLYIQNELGIDVSSNLQNVGTDNRTQYSLNYIYRYGTQFESSQPVKFKIKIT